MDPFLKDSLVQRLTVSRPFSRERFGRNLVDPNVPPASSRLSIVVNGGVGRDTIQPSRKRPLTLEPTDVAKYLEPDLLHAVGNLGAVQHDSITDPMDAVNMTMVQARRGVPIPMLHGLDQGLVRNRIVSIHHSYSMYGYRAESEYTAGKIDGNLWSFFRSCGIEPLLHLLCHDSEDLPLSPLKESAQRRQGQAVEGNRQGQRNA